LEADNRQKLKDFFRSEYRSLLFFVKSKIKDTTNRNAEDIIQDVALKLFTGADRYAPINNVAGFVYRSMRNKIIDIMRTNKKTESLEQDHEFKDLAEILHQSSNKYTSEKMTSLLKVSIENLKSEYRDIIIMVDFEGYTYKEIAKETGIPIGTLMSRRHRAISILYNNLEYELNKNRNQ
jgi:RNA polymerase sigma-70 factor (ECF subfamily)